MSKSQRTVTLAGILEDWVQHRISSGRYADDNEYFTELISRDMDRGSAELSLTSLVDEGLESGIGNHTITEIMTRVAERLKKNG